MYRVVLMSTQGEGSVKAGKWSVRQQAAAMVESIKN